MSARSTPVSNPPSRSNSHSLLSPASSSFDHLPTPTNYPYNRRRQPSTQSFANQSFGLSSVPENVRRPSGLDSRKASQTSVSGTSTPYGSARRRRAREQKPGAGNSAGTHEDWAEVEPDEVFRRLPVGEVRKVEAKMRNDALNKQSELRSMVGTRYRDLLTSATQITALRKSSLQLSKALRNVRDNCSNAGASDVSVTMDNGETPSEADDVMSMLPVAAHMKLLLDAPEALYSYLARHAFLKAAFLWLITRVVKEGLTVMPEDVRAPYIPLLQKQWETLLPFRGQIVQRATASLRSRDKTESSDVAEALLAIILLDNLPVPDALALLFNQRTKTLRDILAHPESSSSKQALSVADGRRRGDSRASLKSMHREREEIGSILGESVKSILETLTLVQLVFHKKGNQESMLEQLQRQVQIGEPLPPTSAPAPTRRTSHERRASRLASISLPTPKYSNSPSGPPVSSFQILSDLPSSQILLRHLPTSITGFTPFIAPSSTPGLDEKIGSWRQAAISILSEAVPSWLASLHSVADVWHVRAVITRLLEESKLSVGIKEALELEWGNRVEGVWEHKLGELLRLADEKVREAGEEIRQKGEENDSNPESFIFSELAFPSAPSSALTASAAPLNAFLASVGKRISLRTPLLDSVLSTLEDNAKNLKADMVGLPASLYDIYGKSVTKTLSDLVKIMERILESMGPARGDGKDGIAAEMFVGRVAIYLSKQSDFLELLTGESQVELDGTITSLIKVHEVSVARWRTKTTEEAIVLLEPIFHPLRGSNEIKASWQGPFPTSPSAPIMVALHSLTSATRQLGIPPGADLPVVKDLTLTFIETAKALPGWTAKEKEGLAQAAFDLSFLTLLSGEDGGDATAQKLLNKLPSTIPPEFKDTLPQLVLDHLRRSQILIHPLIRYLETSKLAPSLSASESRGGLLRFGAPKGGNGFGADFRSPLAVAKPGKRFGLLSIAT